MSLLEGKGALSDVDCHVQRSALCCVRQGDIKQVPLLGQLPVLSL